MLPRMRVAPIYQTSGRLLATPVLPRQPVVLEARAVEGEARRSFLAGDGRGVDFLAEDF